MVELGIFSVIFLAVAYWTVLWLMGRREDVLHGEFVEGDPQSDETVRSIFPQRPVLSDLREKPVDVALPEPAARAALPEQPAFRSERLESLLNSIKQDINQLVQK